MLDKESFGTIYLDQKKKVFKKAAKTELPHRNYTISLRVLIFLFTYKIVGGQFCPRQLL